jgi:HAD superfamily phosphatase (TIGR01668 family)
MLKPDIRVGSVSAITPELLRANGVSAVMVDLDDTIVASGSQSMEAAVKDWFASLLLAGIPVLILSNGERSRVTHWASELGIHGFPMVGKPFWFAFRKGLRKLGSLPEQTAMVGDQLFTDVLGANLMGLVTILVAPLSPGRLVHTRILRRVERRILGGEHGKSVDR